MRAVLKKEYMIWNFGNCMTQTRIQKKDRADNKIKRERLPSNKGEAK